MARRTIRTIAVAICLLAIVAAGQALAQTRGVGTAPMQLRVKDAPVQEVLKLIAESGNFNLAIGAEVKGRVTLYIDEIPPRDLLDIVVGIVDAAYVEENGAVWVMDKRLYEERYGEAFSDRLVSRNFLLTEADAKEVMPTLRDLLGKRAEISADMARNMIRVKGSPNLLREAADLVKMLDAPRESESFELKTVPLTVATGYLDKLMHGRVSFIEDAGNQRLIVSANRFDLDRVREVLTMLDAGRGIESAMLDVSYAEPDSLAEKVRSQLTPDLGQVYSDKQSRKLVVVDYPGVVERIRGMVREYDAPIRQVLIEARIVQVSRSREVRTGIDWEVLEDKVNVSNYYPTLADADEGTIVNFGDSKYDVIMEALETYGNTDLLSSPRLMVVDGGTGSIHVGSQVPYKTIETRENASGVITNFETVVVLDVGIKLEVSARIMGDDMVHLTVHPEVSSVVGETVGVPVIDASTVDSSLMVQDGNTVILGGLIKDESRTVRKGIPLLSRIPLIKYLVSSNVEEKLKSELVILLTPRIMSGRELYQPVESVVK